MSVPVIVGLLAAGAVSAMLWALCGHAAELVHHVRELREEVKQAGAPLRYLDPVEEDIRKEEAQRLWLSRRFNGLEVGQAQRLIQGAYESEH